MPFDDFDTQVQSDELKEAQDFLNWVSLQTSPWEAYEVDDDDGTQCNL